MKIRSVHFIAICLFLTVSAWIFLPSFENQQQLKTSDFEQKENIDEQKIIRTTTDQWSLSADGNGDDTFQEGESEEVFEVPTITNKKGKLHFAHYYRSHMVLQKGPAKAQLWGYAKTIRDTVSIRLNGRLVANATVNRRKGGLNGGIWSALLPPQKAGGPFVIDIRSEDGQVILKDVLFGDVWVCAGQSNMKFELKKILNRSYELSRAKRFDRIRLTKMKQGSSKVPVEDPVVEIPWRQPGTDKKMYEFSSLCLMYAEELAPHINRPIGLVQSSWGGTAIESWSSPDAIAKCPFEEKSIKLHGVVDASRLYNAMIHPLHKMTIYGAIWYQGEANRFHPALYMCQFLAFIADMRAKFHAATNLQTDRQFPFGFVQLAPKENVTLHYGFPDVRWSQTAGYGFVPNPRMQNVFMAVAMDLPDFNGTYGSVHPVHKIDIAKRLALAGRAIAYKQPNLNYQAPFPEDFAISRHTLKIVFGHGKRDLEVRKRDGFEICCGQTANHTCHYDNWQPAPIIEHDQNTVTIKITACKGIDNVVAAVRYAWEESPCQFKMCAVYDRNNDMPAAPFVKQAPFKRVHSTLGTSMVQSGIIFRDSLYKFGSFLRNRTIGI